MNPSLRSPRFWLLLALLAALILGALLVDDYGMSWDEPSIQRYVAFALDAYSFLFHPQDLPDFDPKLSLYGPAFFMLTALLEPWIRALVPAWTPLAAQHFVYFLSFLAGAFVFYELAKRWMSEWAALFAALLLLTQPLLWGHAFINPKDTPFMTFFLTSVYLGFLAADAPARSFRRAALICASGAFLGLTVSFRVVGPLAGALVLAYAAAKQRRNALPSFLFFYLLIAGLTAYLTWPFLWKAPVANYLESLKVMSDFPFKLKILFLGNLYKAEDLPLRYFPTLLVLQLTEPALALMALGAAAFFRNWLRKREWEFGLLFAGWFLFPAAYVILSGSSLYDNARQLVFIYPPLFTLAGMGADWLFGFLPSPRWKFALAALSLLPGLSACVHLHPYQYVYYNQAIGGVGGAYRKFDLDYWGISLKEATEYLNENAPRGAQAVIVGPRQLAEKFARPDLILIRQMDWDKTELDSYYVVYLTRGNEDLGRCLAAETVYAVTRDGGTLSYVKRVAQGQPCE